MRATVAPFRPLRFQAQQVGNLGEVWAPPYDVITPEYATALRRGNPYNIVRLTNPEGVGEDRYAQAAATLQSWHGEGYLVREPQPLTLVHQHSFRSGKASYQRTGVWALLRLAGFDEGIVVPHERTMRGPKADRLSLMRACRAQLSPIFFICSDRDGTLGGYLTSQTQGETAERAEFPSGEEHRIWRVDDQRALQRLASLVREEALLIADGHHRYETALAYRGELNEGGAARTGSRPHEFVLAYIVPEGDPGLLLLPTHRVVAGAPVAWASAVQKTSDRFEVIKLTEAQLESVARILEDERGRPTFVLVARGEEGGWLLRLRRPTASQMISSVALHEVFLSDGAGCVAERQLESVAYVKDVGEAVSSVRSGSAQAAALLAAPEVGQVRTAAHAGERLPPKTTYFWPKVPSGIAIHLIDPNEEIELPAVE